METWIVVEPYHHLISISLHQVHVPRPDQEHNSDRQQSKPPRGDHTLHHRDPHLGRPEWQLRVRVSSSQRPINYRCNVHVVQSSSMCLLAVESVFTSARFPYRAHSFKTSRVCVSLFYSLARWLKDQRSNSSTLADFYIIKQECQWSAYHHQGPTFPLNSIKLHRITLTHLYQSHKCD